jgi:hypothetical protein
MKKKMKKKRRRKRRRRRRVTTSSLLLCFSVFLFLCRSPAGPEVLRPPFAPWSFVSPVAVVRLAAGVYLSGQCRG